MYVCPPLCELVIGPPAAGKTTYVLEHRQHGDLVIDLDLIFQALTGLEPYQKPVSVMPIVFAARDAAVARAFQDENLRKIWVIATGATVQARKRALGPFWGEGGTSTRCLEADENVCMARIIQDGRPEPECWREVIRRFHAEWQPLLDCEL